MVQLEKEYLLKAGVHFGHPTSRWNPNFKPYIAMKKNGIHIIDLETTMKCLQEAGDEISKIVKDGGNILFVGTKKQAKDVVQQEADRCGMYYVVERWLGGTLTNFATIKRSIRRLMLLEKEASEIYDNLTKKEVNMLERERVKLGDLHRGIKDMKHIPAALFFVDGIHEKIAINEAYTLGIPVFGMVDSNTDPTTLTYPIPANDDSIRSIKAVVSYIADRIIEARGGVIEREEEIMDVETTDSSQDEEVIEVTAPVEEETVDTEAAVEEVEAQKDEEDSESPIKSDGAIENDIDTDSTESEEEEIEEKTE